MQQRNVENLLLETADGRQVVVEFASNVHLEDRRHGIEGNIRDITELDQRAGDTARDPSQEDGMTEDEAGTGKADV